VRPQKRSHQFAGLAAVLALAVGVTAAAAVWGIPGF